MADSGRGECGNRWLVHDVLSLHHRLPSLWLYLCGLLVLVPVLAEEKPQEL